MMEQTRKPAAASSAYLSLQHPSYNALPKNLHEKHSIYQLNRDVLTTTNLISRNNCLLNR